VIAVPPFIASLADDLASMRGVVSVVLGGSRATGPSMIQRCFAAIPASPDDLARWVDEARGPLADCADASEARGETTGR
jgi:hypothetical protein